MKVLGKKLYINYTGELPTEDESFQKSVVKLRKGFDELSKNSEDYIIFVAVGNDDKEIKAVNDVNNKIFDLPRASKYLLISNNFTRIGALKKYSIVNMPPKKEDGSNYGKDYVDIMAPGEEIPSLTLDGKAELVDGTSAATAIVTGAAALLLLCKPNANSTEIMAAILEYASLYKELEDFVNKGRVLNILNSVKSFCPTKNTGSIIKSRIKSGHRNINNKVNYENNEL